MPQVRALLVVHQVLLLLDRPAGPLVVVPEQVAREVLQEPVVPQVQALLEQVVPQPQELQVQSLEQYRQWAPRLQAQALSEW